ncbi:DUF1684 domain-containing protein [Belliella kenyensis]|uniref:DUF1684 domain-containing protein n=1 Tax=Belliella kenyensis TaxID=1472724 RepID=A0ABV8EIF8_9BACT|nr:DUF1684 domain-containing protein [Belliella kenyensis]MCH7403478.1 DUF1684 domain-containing protein [Belliella kenyensis]MDN3602378.1 DUF1684 domain-containing protein [Belliella kenyensis]
MNKRNIVLLFIAIGVIASIAYMLTSADDQEVYFESIERERDKQFKFLRYSPESPLDEEQKKVLNTLTFYPIDAAYRVRAKLEPVEDRKMIEIPMTDGSIEKYIKHSYAVFDLQGKSVKLLLLQSKNESDMRNFFLAFADETSGVETYGGGRYLNLRQDGKNSILIDFNLAYNPYCAYNPDFACPLPPKENIMDLAIKVGEKDYVK